MKIFLKCDEANHSCDKNQYKEASFTELIKLNIHLIYCRACRKYTARNTKLSKALRRNKPKGMPLSAKQTLNERLRKEINK